MRSRGPGGADHVAGRAARARAERLWQETVGRPCAPTDDSGGSNAAHLPLSPSPKGGGGTPQRMPVTPSPLSSAARRESQVRGRNAAHLPPSPSSEGGGGTQAAPPVTPSPPLGAERAGERWGTTRPNDPPLPGGPATRKLRALWISAFHLGLTRDRSDGALVAWLHRQKSLDADTCLSADGLARAIQPLEAWLSRAAGVDWRPHLSLGRNGRVRELHRPRARVLEAQWRLLYRQGRVRIGSHAALGAYAARFAGLGRLDSHLALTEAQTDALIRHFGKSLRTERIDRRRAQTSEPSDAFAPTTG